MRRNYYNDNLVTLKARITLPDVGFHSGFGLAYGALGTFPTYGFYVEGLKHNMCLTPVGRLGDIYGNPVGGDGALTPSHTSGGQKITIETDTASGLVVTKLGDAGDEQIPGCSQVITEFESDTIVLDWNSTELRYETNNVGIATAIEGAYGTNVCFALYAISDLVIHYNFAELKREEP
jgi:hypothetical protein